MVMFEELLERHDAIDPIVGVADVLTGIARMDEPPVHHHADFAVVHQHIVEAGAAMHKARRFGGLRHVGTQPREPRRKHRRGLQSMPAIELTRIELLDQAVAHGEPGIMKAARQINFVQLEAVQPRKKGREFEYPCHVSALIGQPSTGFDTTLPGASAPTARRIHRRPPPCAPARAPADHAGAIRNDGIFLDNAGIGRTALRITAKDERH